MPPSTRTRGHTQTTPRSGRVGGRSAAALALTVAMISLLVAGCTQGRPAASATQVREKNMRPVIGITCSFGPSQSDPNRLQLSLNATYMDAIFAAGGLPCPLPLPPEADPAVLDQLLQRCDGVLFTGGSDIVPEHYGAPADPETHVMNPRRDAFELELFRRADEKRLPILTICLGFQVAHVGRGGQLVQHLPDFKRPEPLTHYTKDPNAHPVRITPGSRLAQIVGATEIETNSRHHQAVDVAHQGRGLQPVGFTSDGILEASEDMDGRFLLAVQWHPEDLTDRPEHRRLFEALVEAARRR